MVNRPISRALPICKTAFYRRNRYNQKLRSPNCAATTEEIQSISYRPSDRTVEMTRKCVLCKETNYKKSYSFFSAPKDPETRKKWTEAMAIDNYVVNDDTYVCSKHFTPSDIITHWVSGVPPHVVTIKYKKCRLRPGAIPSTSCESMNNLLNNQEEEYDEFEVNRGTVSRRPFVAPSAEKETFLIPREGNAGDRTDADDPEGETTNQKHGIIEFATEDIYSGAEMRHEESSDDTNNSALPENPDEEQAELRIVNIQEDGKFVYAENEEDSEILYVEAVNCDTADCAEEEVDELPAKKSRKEDSRTIKSHLSTGEEDTSMDMWDSMSNDNVSRVEQKVYRNFKKKSASYYSEDGGIDTPDPLHIRSETEYEDGDDKAMLFEDLLDVYTEVQLPRGWSSMVTSQGHGTTVVYAYMSMTKNGMPYVEKQVFLKSDMKLRCGAANKELSPRMHNLVREGRNRTVQTLSDVEDLVEEFDRRIVCEGCAGEKTRPEDIENSIAYRDVSSRWRHTECPIIVNNGSNRCSKCSTLDSSLTRSRTRRHNAEVHEFATAMMKKEKTIRVLQRLLRKMNKRNQRFETMRDSIKGKFKSLVSEPHKVFMDSLESLNMPKIQKIMMKECLRAGTLENSKTKYSETWVFLCLLLYIESPRMYRYMLLNKYMVLPSMRIIRRYLHQIKTDTQFYNLFQRTVEPFQPSERDDEKEPT